jgi:hypothetical protein
MDRPRRLDAINPSPPKKHFFLLGLQSSTSWIPTNEVGWISKGTFQPSLLNGVRLWLIEINGVLLAVFQMPSAAK